MSGINGPKPLTEEEKTRWVKMYVEENWSIKAIVKRYHRDIVLIRKHLRETGVLEDRRGRGIEFRRADEV